jgi:hypothetical protein
MIHIKRPSLAINERTNKPLRVKFCKTCKHFTEGMCNKFISVSLIDGTEAKVTATDARSDLSMCGVGASYYEAKPEK